MDDILQKLMSLGLRDRISEDDKNRPPAQDYCFDGNDQKCE